MHKCLAFPQKLQGLSLKCLTGPCETNLRFHVELVFGEPDW